MNLSIFKIVESTTVDGPGFRTSIYAAGCIHHCLGCHNPQSWDILQGTPTNIEALLTHIANNRFEQVTFTGGDPFYQSEGFALLAKRIKNELHRNIWCYTGYTFEQLLESPQQRALLQHIDTLVDGRFELSQRDTTLRFRGSQNQRFIDVKKSILENRVVEEYY